MEQVLREIFSSWLAEELPSFTRRDYSFKLVDRVIALVGPRRAGKTYFMYQITSDLLSETFRRKNIAYIDFEDVRLKGLKLDYSTFIRVLHEIYNEKNGRIVLLLDEVQNLVDWQSWLRTLHNSRNYYIFISGSSSKLLSREIATELRGRYESIFILPFTFKEFLRYKKFKLDYLDSPKVRGRLLEKLNEYIEFGGFPEVVMEDDESRKIRLLKHYDEVIFYRDVVERFKIRDLASLDIFHRILIDSFGKLFSISKIAKYYNSLNIRKSKKTIANYLRYFETSLYIFSVDKFSYKVRERVQQPKKVYSIDTGFFSIKSSFSREKGLRMENLVAIYLFKKTLEDPSMNIYYWRDYQQREIDFIVNKGLNTKQLIQVSYISDIDEVERRELDALVKTGELLNCKDMIFITWDLEDKVQYKGSSIKLIPLWKWLLTNT